MDNPATPQMKATKKNGILFIKEDEIYININKNQITITVIKYTRWQEISQMIYNYIDIIFSEINSKVSQITLEFLDEFIILKPELEWEKELFNKTSKYINDNTFSLNDYWHLNQGMFVKFDDIPHKILDNVRINYFRDEQDDCEKVNTINQGRVLLIEAMGFDKDEFKKYFDIIHEYSKNIFQDIVSKNVLSKFDGYIDG